MLRTCVIEWQDVHAQLRQAARDLGVPAGRMDDDELALPAALTGQDNPPPSTSANSASPALSDTEINARFTGTRSDITSLSISNNDKNPHPAHRNTTTTPF